MLLVALPPADRRVPVCHVGARTRIEAFTLEEQAEIIASPAMQSPEGATQTRHDDLLLENNISYQ